MTALVRNTSSRDIVYQRRGAGRPIVLLHGWCLNRRLWTYLEEALIGRFQVLTPDLAGFGESSGLAGPYTLERYAADVEALLEELELTEVTIVGFAFGAAVAMALAAHDPQRLARLVLIGLPSGSTAPYEKMPKAMRRDWPLFAQRSAEAICHKPLSEPGRDWLASMFGGTPLPVAVATCELLGKFDPAELAARVPVPSLLLHGDHDTIVPVEVSRECAERMANGRLEIVSDSGHLVVMDQKESLAELVATFAQQGLEAHGGH
ncbi:MAG: alpha/beta hydrolase [Sinobacteraceae bacterium]|nr:alpha/beta hydrolase [Nevskiaceae bacterium]